MKKPEFISSSTLLIEISSNTFPNPVKSSGNLIGLICLQLKNWFQCNFDCANALGVFWLSVRFQTLRGIAPKLEHIEIKAHL